MNLQEKDRAHLLLDRLETRRKGIGMPLRVVAERSGLGIRTVYRVLCEKEATARLDTVLLIADALSTDFDVKECGTPFKVKREQARKKAAEIASLVQGTSALEGQAVPAERLREIRNQTEAEIIAGSRQRLWG